MVVVAMVIRNRESWRCSAWASPACGRSDGGRIRR